MNQSTIRPMQVTLDFADLPGIRIRRVFRHPLQLLVAHRYDEVMPLLRQVSQACRGGAHAVGFVTYEAAPAFDAGLATHPPYPGLPLALFGLFRDPETSSAPPASGSNAGQGQDWQPDLTYVAYEEAIRRLREAIAAGETYQVNFTLRYLSRLKDNPASLYERLLRVQPADYGAHLQWAGGDLLSLSPELFFRTEGELIEAVPMKGTARPGMPLADCPKNRAENLMIVDLLRNDLGRIAQPGSVRVSDLFAIRELPTVHQMTSTVSARLDAAVTLEHIFAALFPCGSITGAPKRRTMDWIKALESQPRGPYCGAIGWVRPGGAACFSVAIRTLWHDLASGNLQCGLGGGITWDSSAPDEWQEIGTKAAFLDADPPPYDLLETLLLDDGHWPLALYHHQRLARSANDLAFPAITVTTFQQALARFAQQFPQGRYRVRICYNRCGDLHLTGHPLDPVHNPAVQPICLASQPFDFAPHMIHKTTERSGYDAVWAEAEGSLFDILLWNKHGELTEFTRGNLVLEREGRYDTPPLSCGLLAGTLRQSLCDEGKLTERILRVEDLAQAERIWFINSVRGWIPVTVVPAA